jgi:hypothetical protein
MKHNHSDTFNFSSACAACAEKTQLMPTVPPRGGLAIGTSPTFMTVEQLCRRAGLAEAVLLHTSRGGGVTAVLTVAERFARYIETGERA